MDVESRKAALHKSRTRRSREDSALAKVYRPGEALCRGAGVVFLGSRMLQTSASLVVYRTPAAELQPLLETLQLAVRTWVVVDNSAEQGAESDARRQVTLAHGGIYLPMDRNLGFGAGHNVALAWLRDSGMAEPYHLIVNPDIAFDPSIVHNLTQVFEDRPDVGWIMPQVRYQDGSVQPLCKLLPKPANLLGRRFVPKFLRDGLGMVQDDYEMKGIYDLASDDVPFLSGCFVFARQSILQEVGGFDPRYFMYMEDVDLCRRFRAHAKMLYWPEVHVTHGHHRGSYHDLFLTLRHLWSAILYFRRWGWFSDPERDFVNSQALRSLRREIRFARAAERQAAERQSTPAHR